MVCKLSNKAILSAFGDNRSRLIDRKKRGLRGWGDSAVPVANRRGSKRQKLEKSRGFIERYQPAPPLTLPLEEFVDKFGRKAMNQPDVRVKTVVGGQKVVVFPQPKGTPGDSHAN